MPNHCFQCLTVTGDDMEEFKCYVGATNSEYPDAPEFSLNDFLERPGYYDDGEDETPDVWDTKWDCQDVHIEEYDECVNIWYWTAWNAPKPVIEKIAEMFPKLNIYLSYQDEMNNFYGFMLREVGYKLIDESFESSDCLIKRLDEIAEHKDSCPDYCSWSWVGRTREDLNDEELLDLQKECDCDDHADDSQKEEKKRGFQIVLLVH